MTVIREVDEPFHCGACGFATTARVVSRGVQIDGAPSGRDHFTSVQYGYDFALAMATERARQILRDAPCPRCGARRPPEPCAAAGEEHGRPKAMDQDRGRRVCGSQRGPRLSGARGGVHDSQRQRCARFGRRRRPRLDVGPRDRARELAPTSRRARSELPGIRGLPSDRAPASACLDVYAATGLSLTRRAHASGARPWRPAAQGRELALAA